MRGKGEEERMVYDEEEPEELDHIERREERVRNRGKGAEEGGRGSGG